MRLPLLILGFFATILPASAQNPNLDYKYALKGYNQVSYSYAYDNWPGMERKTSSLSWFRPVVGFQWQNKKRNGHEVYLTQLSKGVGRSSEKLLNNGPGNTQTIDELRFTNFSFSAGYDYLLHFRKNKNSKLVPSLGFGVNPYYESITYYRTHQPNNFVQEMDHNLYGINLLLTPRLMYFVSPKFFLDLNVPFCLLENTWEVNSQNNSNNPPTPKRTEQITRELPTFYNFRFGLGLKL